MTLHNFTILLAASIGVVAVIALLTILARAVRAVGNRVRKLGSFPFGSRKNQDRRGFELPAAVHPPFWLDENEINWDWRVCR